ncbi:unnamed protein product [Pocillopora meandrina]|uniref:Uncharacterized protein n=1 Tax=Pocillopora meandrina TaxID=46732 RepID=A0AAU9VMB3_9CNID|nr:unnamed protein product [Pocillopora meandrina]
MTSAHHMKKHSSSKVSPSSSEHKHSRSKHVCSSKTEHSKSRKEQLNDPNIAIISKNRITRQLGIYNKAKRSNTILRENLKQKICKKKFENVKAKTAEDMAKVLDCSSFKIYLSCSGSLQEGQDSPVQHISGERDSLSCSSTGRYSNPDKSRITPVRRITPRQITPQSESMLAFKVCLLYTPLQEISENLTESLRPLETFHGRNYLVEVREQLRKMIKQSSVNSQTQSSAKNVGVTSQVQKRCLKRKSKDEIAASTGYIGNESTAQGNEKHHCDDCLLQNEQHKNLAAMESQSLKTKAQQVKVTQVVSTNASRCKFPMQDPCPSAVEKEARHKEEKDHNYLYVSDVRRCLFEQRNCQFPTTDTKVYTSSNNSSSLDILDFLDGVEQESNVVNSQRHKGYETPNPQLVSPPKKPNLKSPTPEKRFYPHKLY